MLCYAIKLTDWSAVPWPYIVEENKWLPMHKEGKEVFCLRVIYSLLNKLSTFKVYLQVQTVLSECCRIWSAMNTGKGNNSLQPGTTESVETLKEKEAAF